MAKAQKVADVLVRREWWYATVARLLMPPPASGTGELHRVRGPLVGQDFQGIWIGDAPSNLQRAKDGSPLFVHILIPWGQVLALAVIDEPAGIRPGFAVNDAAPAVVP